MKKIDAGCLGLAFLLTASCSAAVGQAKGKTEVKSNPNPAAFVPAGGKIVTKADRDSYNNAVDNFNRATKAFNAAKNKTSGEENSAALRDATQMVSDSIVQLQSVAKLPVYQDVSETQATLHNLIGYLYLARNQKGDTEAAIPELRTTIQLAPNNLNAHNNLGNALRQAQRYDEAAVQYRFVLDHYTPGGTDTASLDPAQIKFNLATVLGQAGKMDESLALFGELTAANPDPATDANYAATYRNYGFFLQKAGRNVEAADALRKAANKDPKDAATWLSAGELYAKSQKYDDAIGALTKALASDTDPKLDVADQYAAFFALGEAHVAKGDVNQGIQDFDRAASLQPRNAVPLYNKGVLQEQTGLKSEAEASYRSALQIDPSNVQIQTALGLLLADEGKSLESATVLAGAVPHLTQDAKAAPFYARLGEQYENQHDYANADQARMQALTLNPNDADTHLALANSYMVQKNYVSALTQYESAAALRPADATIQNQRGVAYKNLKQYPKALKAFKQALALDPSNAQVQNNVGVLNELLGYKAQAIAAYKKALALDPNLSVAKNNLARFARK